MIIVDLIKELMYQQNKTVEQLVTETNLSYDTIEDITKNNIVPTPQVAKIILNVLGIKLEDVLFLY